MKNKYIKTVAKFLIEVFAVTALIMSFRIFTEGMYLIGVPNVDDVRTVTISYPEKTDKIIGISDKENIELAVELTGFLKYSVFEKTDENDIPMITITYNLKNGESYTVSANRDTVWWKGKAHAIKQDGAFIKMVYGIFFSNEVMAE